MITLLCKITALCCINGSDKMKTDGETKEKLIASAKAEFMENGYMKASLRKICSDAGVTTGALYFFFEDKEDLFASIVEAPLQGLINMMATHFAEDEHTVEEFDGLSVDNEAHRNFAVGLVHQLYSNYDVFMLLLTKSQGSRFENVVDNFVGMLERNYGEMAKTIATQNPHFKINEYMQHWLTHMSIDAFIHLLTHEPDEKKAMKHMEQIMQYIIGGWMKMILIPEDK